MRKIGNDGKDGVVWEGVVTVMVGVVVWVVARPLAARCPHPSPLPPSGRGDCCCGRGVLLLAASLLSEPRITRIFADGL